MKWAAMPNIARVMRHRSVNINGRLMLSFSEMRHAALHKVSVMIRRRMVKIDFADDVVQHREIRMPSLSTGRDQPRNAARHADTHDETRPSRRCRTLIYTPSIRPEY